MRSQASFHSGDALIPTCKSVKYSENNTTDIHSLGWSWIKNGKAHEPASLSRRKLYILHLPTLVGRYIRTQLIHRNRLSVLRLRIFDRETCLVRSRIRVNCRGNNPELARVWLLTLPNQLISELVPAASFWSICQLPTRHHVLPIFILR